MSQKPTGSGRNANRGPELPQYMRRSSQQAHVTYSSASTSATHRSTGTTTRNTAGRTGTGTKTTGAGRNGGKPDTQVKRKRKITRSERLMRFALAIFGLLILVVGGIFILKGAGNGEGTTLGAYADAGEKYYDGVSIAGVSVGGMTIEEAKSKVEAAVQHELGTISITLQYDGGSLAFTHADMGLTTDVDELMLDAMRYARDGASAEVSAQKDELAAGGKNFAVTYAVDENLVISKLNSIKEVTDTAPIEPHAIPHLSDSHKQSFENVEGQNGLSLNTAETSALIIAAVNEGRHQDTITPAFDEIPPTMAFATIAENQRLISTFTTEYKYSSSNETTQNRCFNIQKTADIINCHVVQPGETFSFNGVVGPRNKENGWKQANGISGGKEYTLQYGGGICQVSTTLYGAVLRGNIPVPEGGRKKHSIPSDYVPYGLDATVDTSGIDFQFTNDTDAPIYIFAYTTEVSSRNRKITVSLYGQPLPEGVTYEPYSTVTDVKKNDTPTTVEDATIPLGYQQTIVVARDAYTAEVYLQKYVNGEKDGEPVLLYTNVYKGNPAEIHIGTGDRATTPVPEGAELMAGYSPIPSATDDAGAGDTGGVDLSAIPEV